MTTDLRDRIEHVVAEIVRGHEASVRRVLSGADSPIEELFLATMLSTGWRLETEHEVNQSTSGFERAIAPARGLLDPNGGTSHGAGSILVNDALYGAVAIDHLALNIGGRRMVIDIAMVIDIHPYTTALAIELDGHDFHERTKEQAARDKSRDRLLQFHGWKAVRFTGSEIFRGAAACVAEAETLLTSDGDRSFGSSLRSSRA